MIFVTVGTDGPFDRLVRAVDRWAGEAGRRDVFSQIGRSNFHPRHMQYVRFLEPSAFTSQIQSASIVVSHAGMGTILTALHHRKPMVVMPRLASLGEQRNEHQLATVRHLMALGTITPVFDEDELRARLDHIDDLVSGGSIGAYAEPRLIAAIGEFIQGQGASPARPGPS